MPFRPPVARTLPLALSLAALAVAAAGCLGGGPAALRPPHCAPAAAGAQAPASADAGPIAVDYLTALADHRYDRAQGYAHACSTAQQHSLDQLWLWLDSTPVQAIKVADPHIASVGDGVTVQATLFAKVGPKPYSAWVTLGPRTLRLAQARGTWRVRADVSVVHRSDLAAYGVSWLHHPYFINGQRVTIVDAKPADVTAAQQILGKVRTPAGFQYSSFAYVDLPAWRALPEIAQEPMIAHELTHVVTRPMLDLAPHSLLEGIAMYEESAYLAEAHAYTYRTLGVTG